MEAPTSAAPRRSFSSHPCRLFQQFQTAPRCHWSPRRVCSRTSGREGSTCNIFLNVANHVFVLVELERIISLRYSASPPSSPRSIWRRTNFPEGARTPSDRNSQRRKKRRRKGRRRRWWRYDRLGPMQWQRPSVINSEFCC